MTLLNHKHYDIASSIVQAILENLKDRRGIKHALNGIDDDARQEMEMSLTDIVLEVFENNPDLLLGRTVKTSAECFSPVEYLLDEQKIRGWSDEFMARHLGIWPIEKGEGWLEKRLLEKPIDAKMAGRLEALLGSTPDYWLNLQRAYDAWQEARKSR